MVKKIKYGILIALGISVLLVISTNLIHSCSERKVVELEEQIAFLKEEFVPMEFEISKYDNSEIKLKTVLYNLKGGKTGSKVIKLTGDEINFDFQVINIGNSSDSPSQNNNYLFFPIGIYTDQMAITDSVKIFDCYDNNDFPAIYNGITEISEENAPKLNNASKDNIKDTLSLYFKLTKDGKTEFGAEAHGVAVHDIKNVAQFKKGFVYSVVCHPHSGAIEIVRK